MFVRGQLSQGVQTRGILVPQRGVSRDERGRPTVLVVGKNNMAELRVIRADRTVGTNWLVTAGLKPGDKVIVDAGPLVRPGAPVKPQLSRGS
jgi:membrane fusion protein (multidrug efflux system)